MTHHPNHAHTAFQAVVPLPVLARAMMDEGFTLIARENVFIEYARLGKPGRIDPTQVIIIYQSGWIAVDGTAWHAAADLLRSRIGAVA